MTTPKTDWFKVAAEICRPGVSKPVTPHTPGPWATHPLNAQVDAFTNGKALPVCRLLWPTEDRTEAETEANAALIAAAPTMLAIIRYLVDELENRDGYTPGEGTCPECTDFNVPDRLNKGSCKFHQAKALLGD